MMYFLLILFFTSLLSIIIMLGRKLLILKHEQVLNTKEVFIEVPYLKEAKQITINGVKKHGHTLVMTTLRFYIISANSIKENYKKIKTKILNRNRQNQINGEKKEISKFLKIIGEYKQKIREMKHKIRKEENL